jgi:ATP-dependent DNA ligase
MTIVIAPRGNILKAPDGCGSTPSTVRLAANAQRDHGDRLFEAVCKLGLEGIVSKKLDAPYKSGPSKTWLKIKNPNAPAATRALDGNF